MRAMSKEAEMGNVAAAKFVCERAWPEEPKTEGPIDDLLAPYRTLSEAE